MKRKIHILSLFVASSVMLSGCRYLVPASNDTYVAEGTAPIISVTAEQSVTQAEENTEASVYTIRENGKLPSEISELNLAEKEYYFGLIFEALRTIDTDVLSVYSDNAETVTFLNSIKNDEEAASFFIEVLSNMIYFSDSDILLSKDSDYFFSKWYSEREEEYKSAAANGESYTITDDIISLDRETAIRVYREYYDEAPLVGSSLFSGGRAYIEAGSLKIDLDSLLKDTICTISEMRQSTETEVILSFSRLVMGNKNNLSLGFDYIDNNISGKDFLLSFDTDAIMNLFLINATEEDKNSFYWKYYNDYYLNSTDCEILKTYIQNNCISARMLARIELYHPANIDNEYPYYTATGETKEALSGYRIYTSHNIYKFPGSLGDNFSFFYQIVSNLIYDGTLERK